MAETFLMVEDQPDDVILLKYALLKTGLNNPVKVVKNGREAIEYLGGTGTYADRKKFPIPSLIFLDLKLPILDGFNVLLRASAQKANSCYENQPDNKTLKTNN